jgi:hypothetical protein
MSWASSPGPDLQAVRREILAGTKPSRAAPGSASAGPRVAYPGAVHQLPPDIAEFTGREVELSELRVALPPAGDLAAGTALVISAIDGMAGVGKTRLAVHLAHHLVHSGRYRDVQLYVDLRGHAVDPPADPAAVLGSFLASLGVPQDEIPSDLDARSALYRNRLTAGTPWSCWTTPRASTRRPARPASSW